MVGSVSLAPAEVLKALADRLPMITVAHGLDEVQTRLLFDIRMPRVVMGGVVLPPPAAHAVARSTGCDRNQGNASAMRSSSGSSWRPMPSVMAIAMFTVVNVGRMRMR